MKVTPRKRWIIMLSMVLSLMVTFSPMNVVWATLIEGSSSAFGESVNLTTSLLGVVTTVTSGPLPTAAGSGPPPYNNSNFALSANVTLLPLSSLQTGLLVVNAFSNSSFTQVSANATVNNLAISLLGTGVLPPVLFSLNATTLQSTALLQDNPFQAVGTTTLVGATLGGALIGAPINLAVNPAPNTTIFNNGGISVLLNEQIFGGDGVTNRSLSVNALRINFKQAPIGLHVLNGDIVISHSEVASVVPEPSTALLLSSGFAMLGAYRWIQRKRVGSTAT